MFPPGQTSTILTLYNVDGEEQLAFMLGNDISMYYEDEEGLPEEGNRISFGVAVDDGE